MTVEPTIDVKINEVIHPDKKLVIIKKRRQ